MSNLKPGKKALVGFIEDIAKKKIAPLLKAIDKAKQGGATFENLQPQRDQVLGHYDQLSNLLSQLIGSDQSLASMMARYKIEGLTGKYASVPEVVSDGLEADHQPQKSILMWLSEQPYFQTAKNMQARAANQANQGYAINLHRNRHKEGRTWGNKGSTEKKNFTSWVDAMVSQEKTDAAKKVVAITFLREVVREDADVIKGVVNRKRSDPVWDDINKSSLTDSEKDQLVEKIRKQVEHGEDIIASQDLNSLKK